MGFAALPLLSPDYSACTFDYRAAGSPVTLQDWLEVFRKSIPTYKSHCLTDVSVPEDQRKACSQQFEAQFSQVLDALASDPDAPVPGFPTNPINCLNLCRIRDQCLRNAGFGDIFLSVKAKENEQALQLLPALLQELDAIAQPSARLELALRGVFAGNIFDLGAAASAQQYAEGGISFAATRQQLLARPWAVDDLEAVLAHCQGTQHRKAVMFVDNAGADVLLGMLPLARELLKLGTQVVVAANSGPTINDITAAELQPLVQRAGQQDSVIGAALAEGRLLVQASGSCDPVIDLSQVSEELAVLAADADLVVLEGMGRGIETNLYARFSCASLKLGMIKHPEVALMLGGRMYDCVCKFDEGLSNGRVAAGAQQAERVDCVVVA